MSDDLTFDLVWMQRLGGGTETLERGIPVTQAMLRLVEADRQDHGVGGVCFLRPSDEADPQAEIARLREQLADVMRAGDLEHARMAALYEACEVFAQFVESYGPQSPVAQSLPTFYANLRVYGKNARAAVNAVRTQADALVAELTAARVGIAAEQELRARSEMIVLAARKVVAGPESVNYTQLAAALDAYDQAAKARAE